MEPSLRWIALLDDRGREHVRDGYELRRTQRIRNRSAGSSVDDEDQLDCAQSQSTFRQLPWPRTTNLSDLWTHKDSGDLFASRVFARTPATTSPSSHS